MTIVQLQERMGGKKENRQKYMYTRFSCMYHALENSTHSGFYKQLEEKQILTLKDG